MCTPLSAQIPRQTWRVTGTAIAPFGSTGHTIRFPAARSLSSTARFAGGSPGLLVLPAYIPPEEVQQELGYTMGNLVNAVIGIVIAMVVSFIACWILFGIWKK